MQRYPVLFRRNILIKQRLNREAQSYNLLRSHIQIKSLRQVSRNLYLKSTSPWFESNGLLNPLMQHAKVLFIDKKSNLVVIAGRKIEQLEMQESGLLGGC